MVNLLLWHNTLKNLYLKLTNKRLWRKNSNVHITRTHTTPPPKNEQRERLLCEDGNFANVCSGFGLPFFLFFWLILLSVLWRKEFNRTTAYVSRWNFKNSAKCYFTLNSHSMFPFTRSFSPLFRATGCSSSMHSLRFLQVLLLHSKVKWSQVMQSIVIIVRNFDVNGNWSEFSGCWASKIVIGLNVNSYYYTVNNGWLDDNNGPGRGNNSNR